MLNNNLLSNSTLLASVKPDADKEILTQHDTVENIIINKTIKIEPNDNNEDCEINHENFNLADNKKNVRYFSNDNNQLPSDTRDSIIIKCKTENLYASPKHNNTLLNVEGIKVEKSSPEWHNSSDSDTNSRDWMHKKFHEVSGETPKIPIVYKQENYNPRDDIEANIQKRKKLSTDIDDYDRLSDVLASDLHNYDLNGIETIDMLHDVNYVLDFEEAKVSANFFSSTAMSIVQNENDSDSNTFLQIDPLFIPDNLEKNENLKDTGSRAAPQRRYNKSGLKRKATEYNNKSIEKKNKRTKKFKYSDKDADTNYDTITDILGELDIDMEFEKTGDNEIIEDKTMRLYNLEVKITHKIPPQHEIEHTAGSRPLTKVEKNQFLKYGPLKSGAFTPTEDKVIKNNWAIFCKTHDWDSEYVEPFLSMKGANKFHIRSVKERKKFAQFLANDLPWRSLYSVYHRFRYLYGSHERNFKRYTSNEDKKIVSFIRHKRNKKPQKMFSQLAKMLHRTSHSVWLRYQWLKKKDQASEKSIAYKVNWRLSLIRKFIQTFLDVTLSENVEELKDAVIPKAVWLKLEEKLGIDYNVLKSFWINQLHMQLFCPERIYLSDIKIKLIEYVYGKGFSNAREIVWRNVAKYFDGIPSIFLCKVFLYLVQACAIKIGTSNFPVIVEYLYANKIKDIRSAATDKLLPRLSYDTGVVKIVDENINEDI